MFLLLDYFETGEIEVFVDIFIPSFNFANICRGNILQIWQLVTWLWRFAQTLYTLLMDVQPKGLLPVNAR